MSYAITEDSVPKGSARVIRSPLAGAQDGSSLSAATLHPRLGIRPSYLDAAGGLRMPRDNLGGEGDDFVHLPVMVREVVELLAGTPGGVVLDATVGGGGHAAAVLAASSRHRLIGLDRDRDAIGAAAARLGAFGARAVVVHARFDQLADVLEEIAPGEPVSGVLFDLGVSSRQFDEPSRGFSYRFDGPLDMRMDRDEKITAAELVNSMAEEDMARLFAGSGEVRFAYRIARAVVGARPVTTTSQLAQLVRASIPAAARNRGGHPARRVFQALRIAVNGELELLGPAVDEAMEVLAPGGRCVVLSYHSGEDRLVKDRFAAAAAGWCTCPREIGCVCGAVPAMTVLTRGARLPGEPEQRSNPRSSSARLRAAERLDAPFPMARKPQVPLSGEER
ncbi:MAG: 16S rRNA (cytosine(1402)-N(4))-methyltransferase RsmH [Acidimicrobiales bacterium]